MWTRPDIAFAVSQVARFQSDPSVYHWALAKLLEYLIVLSRYQYLISLANLFVSHVLVTSLLF